MSRSNTETRNHYSDITNTATYQFAITTDFVIICLPGAQCIVVTNIGVDPGANVTISCNAKVTNNSSVLWYYLKPGSNFSQFLNSTSDVIGQLVFNGFEIDSSFAARFSISQNKRDLIIYSTLLFDAGTYICSLFPSLSRGFIQLIVLGMYDNLIYLSFTITLLILRVMRIMKNSR